MPPFVADVAAQAAGGSGAFQAAPAAAARYSLPSCIMSSSSSTLWSDACDYATGRPLQTKLDSVYVSHSITVR